MSEMPKAYDPKLVEGPVFESWTEGRYFEQPVVDGVAPFTIVIPPPNVTGSLHMGHALNNTIQDVLVRRMRMTGRPTRWIVGTDHAGIATQNKVEQKLAAQGLSRYDLGREKFIEACWEWRREHGSTIISQLKAMGCSCDFSDEHFTMDPGYQEAVKRVFVRLYEEGLIYRGNRIINWCPRCTTALSDIEVEHEELESHLWHLRYPLKEPRGGVDHIVVATTRPETMLGDTCVAVNPDDERYKDLVGATVVLPLLGREIPIVADEYVDSCFGTGAVKVTPAHDPNDFEIGQRHSCAMINVFDKNAVVTEEGGPYAGLDRYEARKRVIADLDAAGLLESTKEHAHAVGHCYRCRTVVEPWLSDQWFVDMAPLAAPAIDVVRDGKVAFHPERWSNVYFHWMENIRDWCVSRQLWWGHQIPVYYCDACNEMVVSEHDVETCPNCGGAVRQDPDVLDTWFSSALWPFAVFGWPDDTPELAHFYPTSVLSTARDILFLWVARMIMQGLHFVGDIPYTDVIIHPTVFNAEGKRMSKSLGTGVDPLDLMEHYGADGMRFGLMLQTTGNQDIKFAEEKLASSRNFANKIWNASRFVLMNLDDYEPVGGPEPVEVADRWILSRLAKVAETVDRNLDVESAKAAGCDAYDFGEAARSLYEFFWSEFCDWYIEMAKPRLAAGGEARKVVQRNLVFVLDQALRLLHPMMPFVTEEIWSRLPLPVDARVSVQPHSPTPSLMVASWPTGLAGYRDESVEDAMRFVQDVVTEVRAVRARQSVPPKDKITVAVYGAEGRQLQILEQFLGYLNVLAGVDEVAPTPESVSRKDLLGEFTVQTVRFAALGDRSEGFDADVERDRLTKKLAKIVSERAVRSKKLANAAFVANAKPEVVEKVRAEEAELHAEEDVVRRQLESLG